MNKTLIYCTNEAGSAAGGLDPHAALRHAGYFGKPEPRVGRVPVGKVLIVEGSPNAEDIEKAYADLEIPVETVSLPNEKKAPAKPKAKAKAKAPAKKKASEG